MATEQELSDFLKNTEKRAFKRTLYHVRNEESALDIVQDSKTPIKECAFTQDLLTALDGDAYIIHRLPVYLEKRMARLRKEADLRIKDLREEQEEALKYRYVDLSYKYHDMA